VLPPSYAKRFTEGLGGPHTIRLLDGARHRVDLDAPEALAEVILASWARQLLSLVTAAAAMR